MGVGSKIKKVLFDLAKKNKGFRVAARGARDAVYRAKMLLDAPFDKVDERLVYFQTFSGRGYSDSPKAIYEYMLNSPEYADYRFVWSFREPDNYPEVRNDRTHVVQYRSRADNRALRTAKYWISNYRMLDHQHPRKDQVYLQCWHGTPLKRLGYDLTASDNSMNSLNEIRNKYRTDAAKFTYLLSPSPFATEKFASAWNLVKTGQTDKILEVGYPRNDRLVNASDDERDELRRSLGVDGRKVILYAPTWRDNQHTSGEGYTYKTEVDFDKLKTALGDEYVILFRAHYLVANAFDFGRYEGFVQDASHHSDINDLYIASDLLVTDYSSVFFDYANLKKPVIFYMYDLDDYASELRGFYLSLDELPGPIVRDEEGLMAEIRRIEAAGAGESGGAPEPDEKYEAFHAKYNPLDDGKAAERVAEAVIHV